MDLDDLKKKNIAVLGYGAEGQAVTRYLLKHGLRPVLFDHKPWENFSEKEQAEIVSLGIPFIFGANSFEELAVFQVAFKSPGIPYTQALRKWQSAGLKITSQTQWFFHHSSAKIIGVTGTKGKGTTSALVYQILKNATETPVYLTGNIGKVQPMEILDGLSKDAIVVFELSSFQLQDMDRSPYLAVVLMVTEDHLDYHTNVQEYRLAKSNITRYQTPDDISIINLDYPGSLEAGNYGLGKKLYVSTKTEMPGAGCFVRGKKIIVRGIGSPGEEEILDLSNILLKGKYNWENIVAAVAVSKILGVKSTVIRETVKAFPGLEHRLEYVGNFRGISFYDDSFSTIPWTAISALLAMEDIGKTSNPYLIIILGGSEKYSDYTELGKKIAEASYVKAVVLIGETAERIKHAIELAAVREIKYVEGEMASMREIFVKLKTIASPGDVVLLSPACASFGMFKNYIDRGTQFKEFANKW